MLTQTDTAAELVAMLNLPEDYSNKSLELLKRGESRYLKDLKVNLKNVLSSDHLDEKEAALIGLAIAANQNNTPVTDYFEGLSKEKGASDEEIAEAVACASLLASNNVFYRFRHFANKKNMNNTYNITLVGPFYKIEDTGSGDAHYFPREACILKTNLDDVIIETSNGRYKGLKSHPYTQIEVGGVTQASAQATIDAIATLT